MKGDSRSEYYNTIFRPKWDKWHKQAEELEKKLEEARRLAQLQKKRELKQAGINIFRQVKIKGVDVYDPTTGALRSSSTDDIACWFLDTAYDGEGIMINSRFLDGMTPGGASLLCLSCHDGSMAVNAYGNPIEHYGELDVALERMKRKQKGPIKQFV